MNKPLAIAALSLAACLTSPAHADWFGDTQEKMGTRVEIRLWHDDEAVANSIIAAGMAEFDRIEDAMSTYRSDSEITQLNESAANRPFVVSAELYALVERALQLSGLTDGAFDITYDSVGQLYDYRARLRPDDAALAAGLSSIGFQFVELNRVDSTIRYAREGVKINLGGIAKGYAVESVTNVVRQLGVTNALVTAGGDTRLLGDKGNGPWVVGVRDPDDEAGVVTRFGLQDEAISTSGDYERFFDEGDVRHHHILNPTTGESAGDLRSVTIIGPDATMTDGLSTSVFVLGPEKGMTLIESMPDFEALLIDVNRRVQFSSGLNSQ